MASQGTTSLIVRNVVGDVFTGLGGIQHDIRNSEGYIGASSRPGQRTNEGLLMYTYIVGFTTAMDAAKAHQLHPQMVINGQTYPVLPYYPDDENDEEQSSPEQAGPSSTISPTSDVFSPPRKRQKTESSVDKIQCKVCFVELDGPYSTPCRRCASPRCYDCLREEFLVALKHRWRMPVTCCQVIMHHEVARGVLSEAEIDLYRLRYDESKTVDPVYCPVPTCSTFIPPRMVKHRSSSVKCPTCGTPVCTKCKQLATTPHVCSKDAALTSIVETFHYKLCPKCGTGVMKMFGCPHVRCHCGAHWCWDCQRPMASCNRRPCPDLRQFGGEEENEALSEDEPDTVVEEQGPDEPDARGPEMDDMTRTVVVGESSGDAQLQSADTVPMQHEPYLTIQVGNSGTARQPDGAPNPALVEPGSEEPVPETAASVRPSTETNHSHRHLDHNPNPAENTDLATEPALVPIPPPNLDDPDEFDWEGGSVYFGEEPTDEAWDIWGCQHHFRKFGKDSIPDFWLPGVDRRKPDGILIECMSCFKETKVWESVTKGKTIVGSGESKATIDIADTDGPAETGHRGKLHRSEHTYECKLCGVIYCGTCRKAAARRVQEDREAAERD